MLDFTNTMEDARIRAMKVALALVPVFDTRTPPLGLAYLKSSLTRAGHDCRCVDFTTEYRSVMVSAMGDRLADEDIAGRPELCDKWAAEVCRDRPEVVGFSVFDSNVNAVTLVAARVRDLLPEALIVCGGPSLVSQIRINIERCLRFCDCVIEGEGETALVELVDAYAAGEPLSNVRQVWVLNDLGVPVYSGPGPQQPIDDIPFPDFTDFRREAYPFPDRLPILFSRGCIINCSFCTNKYNHLTQRTRRGENVFSELMRDVEKYGISEFIMNDDSLISRVTFDELEHFADRLIESGHQLTWSVYGTRVDKLLTHEYVQKLGRSGLNEVHLGVESFSSGIQRDMCKTSNYELTDRVIRMFVDAGVSVGIWIIYGYPVEEEQEFAVLLRWLRENPNLLSHITANCFSPNHKYMNDRPGIVEDLNWNTPWSWHSAKVDLETRVSRFLQLADALEAARVASSRGFHYVIGDPYYTRYLDSWNDEIRKELETSWASAVEPDGAAGAAYARTSAVERRAHSELIQSASEEMRPVLERLIELSARQPDRVSSEERELLRRIMTAVVAHAPWNPTGAVPDEEQEFRTAAATAGFRFRAVATRIFQEQSVSPAERAWFDAVSSKTLPRAPSVLRRWQANPS
jgi:radical SAM superfamily enzyme YgiQ (UPF0313 family)